MDFEFGGLFKLDGSSTKLLGGKGGMELA